VNELMPLAVDACPALAATSSVAVEVFQSSVAAPSTLLLVLVYYQLQIRISH